MVRLIADLESDGLLPELTKIHCIVAKDIDTGEVHSFGPDSILDGITFLQGADLLVGHNLVSFDIPAIQKVYPWFEYDHSKVEDTLVLAKLYAGNIKEYDLKDENKHLKLFGQQSLKAWGIRLGMHKGDYSGGWDAWSQEMQDYCERDVEVTFKLYKHLTKGERWPVAERLEHDAAWLCSKIERNGIPFDVPKAAELYAQLTEIRDAVARSLKDLFPPWVTYQGEVVSKANNKKTGHTIGAVYSKVAITEFNPQSRDHIINRLKAKYGWEPTEFTKKVREEPKPKVDETVLAKLPYPEAKQLAELFLIEKRIGQIAEGDEGWLRKEQKGFIYHRLNPNGAVTGRATHSKINISQVPRVGSRFGKECRELFGLIEKPLRDAGLWDRWKDGVLFGSDAAGLELRCLAHFMSRWDGGAYGKAVVEGKEETGTDVHSLNTVALGFETQTLYNVNGKQRKGRDVAKTFIYAFLYGAGDAKIGATLGVSTRRAKKIKEDFLKQTPALKALREAVDGACAKGYLRGLDGRHIHVRSPNAALNTLLQGAGAAICKSWIVETERLLTDEGLKHGWDGDFAFLIWSHDEMQIACIDTTVADIVAICAEAAIKNVEDDFSITVPLDVSGKTGRTWADTH